MTDRSSSSSKTLEDFGPNAGYVAELLKLYESGSPLVDSSWQKFFGGDQNNGQSAGLNRESILAQLQVMQLISSYRKFGHRVAKINPIKFGAEQPKIPEDLVFENYNFDDSSLKQNFFSFGLTPENKSKPAEIHDQLRHCYCGSVGFEFEHIADKRVRDWMTNLIEKEYSPKNWFNKEDKLRYLERLIEAEALDMFLHTRFIGAKRFSILGGETLVVLLQSLLESSARQGVEDITLAMAHRGRINAVVTFAGKPYTELVAEFEDKTTASQTGGGDVKYHLGGSKVHTIDGHKIRVTLPPNPSHLEFVNPVANGMVRAKQDHEFSGKKGAVLALSVHGDSSFAGQGVVAETLNFSRLRGYETAGTVHLIINNQVGFTTAGRDSRSTTYCSDLAKGFDVPIFHVNSEDIEASAWVADAALRFRQEFQQDVVIDLVCSRKFGHNEGDDPSFTQPLLYRELSSRDSVATVYLNKLLSDNSASQTELDTLKTKTIARVKAEFEVPGKSANVDYDFSINEAATTAVEADRLGRITEALVPTISDFEIHPKLKTILVKRKESLSLPKGIDWGLAEALAFGSLLMDEVSIRISGQDSGRGTFSHRHLELHDNKVDKRIFPLAELAKSSNSRSKFEVFNSPLSEAAVMGFDFGYSVQNSKTLVLWEGQFGDFANGAQVIIDQFLSSSEQKWNQRSGLVLLLPHGFEGQGPEHSSARLERFLQLCSHNNMTVAFPSSPAQYFHLLRRQALSITKRPLVIMTPKSMLRLVDAGSSLEELTSGSFEKVLCTGRQANKKQAIVFCSGKVFYALRKVIADSAKIIRIEQLYPWPEKEIKAIISTASKAYWVQEEPENMGAWQYVAPKLRSLGLESTYFGRETVAGVATGSPSWHIKEEKSFIDSLEKALK